MGCRRWTWGRQAGRERAGNVVHAAESGVAQAVAAALRSASGGRIAHPYGDGRAGERIAAALAEVNPHDPRLRANAARIRCAGATIRPGGTLAREYEGAGRKSDAGLVDASRTVRYGSIT